MNHEFSSSTASSAAAQNTLPHRRAFLRRLRCRERRRFVGRIADQILEEIEDQCTITGVDFSFKVSGTF